MKHSKDYYDLTKQLNKTVSKNKDRKKIRKQGFKARILENQESIEKEA